jgi:DNA primase
MRIPAETVEQIRSISNIVEVISDFVSLKKRGSNWIACCPFHAERTPSFAASQSKNIFKCFGCGKGGDSITFVMEIENCSYTEALRYLAQKYHITSGI